MLTADDDKSAIAQSLAGANKEAALGIVRAKVDVGFVDEHLAQAGGVVHAFAPGAAQLLVGHKILVADDRLHRLAFYQFEAGRE